MKTKEQLELFENLKEEGLWNMETLSGFLNVSTKTVRDWVYKRQIPFVKVGRLIRFKRSDIEAWLDQGSVSCRSPK